MNRSGFTLVEVVVSMLIVSMIMVATSSILSFTNNIFFQTKIQKEQKQIYEAVEDYITRELTYVNNITLASSPNSNSNQVTTLGQGYTDEKGRLYTDAQQNFGDVFTEAFYLDNDLQITFSTQNPYIILVDIIINSPNGITHHGEFAIRLLNIELDPNTSIQNNTGTSSSKWVYFSN